VTPLWEEGIKSEAVVLVSGFGEESLAFRKKGGGFDATDPISSEEDSRTDGTMRRDALLELFCVERLKFRSFGGS
jgi:hypothetical protein